MFLSPAIAEDINVKNCLSSDSPCFFTYMKSMYKLQLKVHFKNHGTKYNKITNYPNR